MAIFDNDFISRILGGQPSSGQPVNSQTPSAASIAMPSLQNAQAQDYQNAMMSRMGQLGMMLVAAGQRMTPKERATIFAQAPQYMDGIQGDVMNAAQARLMGARAQQEQDEQARQAALMEKLKDPAFAQSVGINPETLSVLGPQGAYDALKARAAQSPADIAYKMAMVKKMQEGDARQWQVVGEDEMGNKRYGYPPLPGEVATGAPTALPGSPPATSGQPQSVFDIVGNSSGQEALDKLKKANPSLAAEVESVVAGNQPLPARLMGTKRGEVLSALVSQIGGQQFDPNAYKSRQTLANEMSKGTPGSLGGQRNFGNTAIKHAEELYSLIPKLDNYSGVGSHLLNTGKNAWHGFKGDATNLQKWNATATNLADEIAKFYGAGGVEERRKLTEMFDPSKSPEELKAAIQEQVRDMYAKTSNLENQWNETMGPVQSGRKKIVFDDTRKAADRILKGEPSNAAIPAARPIIAGPNGHRLQLSADGKRWEDIGR